MERRWLTRKIIPRVNYTKKQLHLIVAAFFIAYYVCTLSSYYSVIIKPNGIMPYYFLAEEVVLKKLPLIPAQPATKPPIIPVASIR